VKLRLNMLEERPRTRGDCSGGPRPCRWEECRYHLPSTAGRPADLVDASCALDLADDGPLTNEEIGAVLGVSRERVRQLVERIGAMLCRDDKRFPGRGNVVRELRSVVQSGGFSHGEQAPEEEADGMWFDGAFKSAVDRAFKRIVPASERWEAPNKRATA